MLYSDKGSKTNQRNRNYNNAEEGEEEEYNCGAACWHVCFDFSLSILTNAKRVITYYYTRTSIRSSTLTVQSLRVARKGERFVCHLTTPEERRI
jgi:hypothetical protein